MSFKQAGFLIAACLAATPVLSQDPARLPRPTKVAPGTKLEPKLEAVAPTRLLMEGLAHPNFRGLERILKKEPGDDQAWTFARGQALLIAETGNLLMLRPPQNKGEPVWFARAMELRTAASQLADAISKHDYKASRTSLVQLADHCNRCHKNFMVQVDVRAFDEKAPAPRPEPGK